jgi:hypothetical protein
MSALCCEQTADPHRGDADHRRVLWAVTIGQATPRTPLAGYPFGSSVTRAIVAYQDSHGSAL